MTASRARVTVSPIALRMASTSSRERPRGSRGRFAEARHRGHRVRCAATIEDAVEMHQRRPAMVDRGRRLTRLTPPMELGANLVRADGVPPAIAKHLHPLNDVALAIDVGRHRLHRGEVTIGVGGEAGRRATATLGGDLPGARPHARVLAPLLHLGEGRGRWEPLGVECRADLDVGPPAKRGLVDAGRGLLASPSHGLDLGPRVSHRTRRIACGAREVHNGGGAGRGGMSAPITMATRIT